MNMPYKQLSSGIDVPILGLGTWQLQGATCVEVIKKAFAIGYRHFDTAAIYKNHEAVAEGLAGKPRGDIFLVSKLWHEEHHPDLVEPALDRSLKELKTDYLDLYLVHWPKQKAHFPEVMYEMEKMCKKGKIRSMGTCNATIHHMQDVLNQGLDIPVNQVELHPFFQQEELAKFCRIKAIAMTAYSPLARGAVLESPVLQKLAEKHGKTAGQIALAWCLKNNYIVIPKATSEKHLQENFAASSLHLSQSDMDEIRAIDEDRRLILPDFAEFDY